MKFIQLNILLLLLVMVAISGCGVPQRLAEEKEFKERLSIAQAMFDEHCKKSGVTIHKKVSDVEGFFIMKIRPKEINFSDQFRMNDPYGDDLGGDAYIKMFLRGANRRMGDSIKNRTPYETIGYSYVEAIDPKDGQRYRYTGSIKDVEKTSSVIGGGDGRHKFIVQEFTLDKIPILGPPPRYGVTYDDISTHKDREYWIAGSSLRVIDLKTNEVLAERIGYMMDYGQGSKKGGRSSWLFAADNACPGFQRNPLQHRGHGFSAQTGQTEYFIEQVLLPKMEHK